MSRFVRFLIVICTCAGLTSCSEPVAQVESPSSYSRDGLAFHYPANWKITEDDENDGDRNVTLESSGSVFVFLHVTENASSDFIEYVKVFSGAMVDNMPAYFKRDAGTLGEPAKWNDYDTVTESYNGEIPWLPSQKFTVIYRRKGLGEKMVFGFLQIAEEDEAKVVPGFDLVLSTLKLEMDE